MQEKPTKPLMLSTQQLLFTYWPQVEPLLAKSPVVEEFPPETIKQAVLSGQMFIFVFTREADDGPVVELAMVLAPTSSEVFPVMNIVTIVGKDMRKHVSQHWEQFKGWCHMIGARAIDAYVPEQLELFMDKELGFKKETTHVRLRL